MNKILEQQEVKDLVTMFNLETPPTYKFGITGYELEDSKVIISEISVYDSDGKFIKIADINKVFKYLRVTDTQFVKDV
jgi:hypothetical protein